jgi:tyrosyl-tRNA synthetase
MLLQAHDFLRLEEEHGCQLQIGGSDQWGNMLGGVDLIRRVHGRPAWVLAWPLLTAPDGSKLGKTTGARVWLDPARTSPYQFFQHWMHTDDRQVGSFLAQFTMLPVAEVAEAMAAHDADPGRRSAQRLLAREATRLVHGDRDAAAAEEASGILFGTADGAPSLDALDAVAREVPVASVAPGSLEPGLDLVEVLSAPGFLVASKGEARRAIDQGGVYVNGERVGAGRQLTRTDLLHDRYVLVRRGKRTFGVVEVGA